MQFLERVVVNGNVLASLYHNILPGHSGCEGLLTGYVQKRTEEFVDDHHDIQRRTYTDAVITGVIANTIQHSLINSCGEVKEMLLKHQYGQLQQQAVVGWFVVRKEKMKPSMREIAGCENMIRQLQKIQPQSKSQPLVFAIFQKKSENNGATVSVTQRFYQTGFKIKQQDMCRCFLTPIPCKVNGGAPLESSSNTSNEQHLKQNALSQDALDTVAMKIAGVGLTTSILPEIEKVGEVTKIAVDACNVQNQAFNKMYGSFQAYTRDETIALAQEMVQLSELGEQVDALRKELYFS